MSWNVRCKYLASLTRYTGGKNILTFDPEYKALREPDRPTMTLTQRMDIHYLDRALVSFQRVPAVLSNLLPEGALRELLSEALKIYPANEFPLLAWVGNNLPSIQLPDEAHAYAIRRFDRSARGRIHTEDFAQVFEFFAHDKYGKANYEQVANALYRYGAGGLGDIQQMARRLLANILLANGDALTAARDLWPGMLQDLPMHALYQEVLRFHWSKLSADFKLL